MSNPMTAILLAPIRWYQKYISPGLPARCRYYPTCSSYTVQAIEVHGLFKGAVLGAWRFLRCNPWTKGGVDHVPPRGSWKAPEWVPPEDWAGHGIDRNTIAARLRGEDGIGNAMSTNHDSARKVEAVSSGSVPMGVEDQDDQTTKQHKES